MKRLGITVLTLVGFLLGTGCPAAPGEDEDPQVIDADITVYFLNGYRYANPRMWFWEAGSAGGDVTLTNTTNINGYPYAVYKKKIVKAATYYFKFYDTVKGWEDYIVEESVQRGITLTADGSQVYFVSSYNYNIFNTVASLQNILSNAPYNMTNRQAADYLLPGAQPVSGGYVFSVFGPRATSASVAGTLNGWSATADPLKFDPYSGLWWKFKSGVSLGANYKFVLNGTTWLGDPYGRAYNDGDNQNTVLISTNYNWNDSGFTRPDKDVLVIYETHIKDFTRDDSGVSATLRGKYAGMIEKISYLTDLGINAVEIMPIQEWRGTHYSWGYNNSGYFAPENSYSTNANNGAAYQDFKALVDALHQAGIAVILDVVYNHTDNTENYLWAIDNNYFFDPAGTPWGNKINMRNPLTRKYFLDNMKYWMDEFHIDGFRLDSTENIDSSSIIAMVNELQDNGYADRYFIFEEFSGGGNSAIQSHNTAQGYSAISSWGTGYKYAIWNAVNNGTSDQLGKVTYYSRDDGWKLPSDVVNYFSSHDEGTLAGRQSATKQEVKVAATHLLTAMGLPMIWMGDEFMRLHYGNYPPSGDGIDEANNQINWSLLITNNDLLSYYANLIALRIQHPSLRLNIDNPDPAGKFAWETDWSGGLIGYSYYGVSGDNNFVVLNNYRTTAKVYGVTFPNTGTWYIMSDGVTNTADPTGLSSFTVSSTAATNISIPAQSGLVFKSADVNP